MQEKTYTYILFFPPAAFQLKSVCRGDHIIILYCTNRHLRLISLSSLSSRKGSSGEGAELEDLHEDELSWVQSDCLLCPLLPHIHLLKDSMLNNRNTLHSIQLWNALWAHLIRRCVDTQHLKSYTLQMLVNHLPFGLALHFLCLFLSKSDDRSLPRDLPQFLTSVSGLLAPQWPIYISASLL